MIEKPKRKVDVELIALILASILLVVALSIPSTINLYINGQTNLGTGINKNLPEVHILVTIEKSGKTILRQYHAGYVTKIGMNFTLGKLTGNTTLYNGTQFYTNNYNITYVSIGNQGTLNTDSTVLPGEWNRTSATQHDGLYNSCNWTAVFTGTTGSQTADCVGLNWVSGIGMPYSLFCFDSFSEVTGIDSTFTITIEFKVSLS